MTEVKDIAVAMAAEKNSVHMERVDSEDSIHRNIVGQDATELSGYWKSYRFLGSLLAICLMANSLFVGYAMPVRVSSSFRLITC